MLHGFLDTARTWEAAVGAGLGEGFHVVAADLRGHGDSDRVGPGGYYHFFDYLPDIAGIVERLAPKRLALVGHSMGGTLASYFAGTFPDRVEHLALLEGIGPPEDDTDVPDRVRAWAAAWKRRLADVPRSYPTVGAVAERLLATDPKLTQQRALRLAETGTTELENGERVFKHDLLHLSRGPYPFRVDIAESFWRRVRCPVLYVDGEESSYRALGREVDRRLACFEHVERVTLPNAGHMLQRHQPELLAGVLQRFLRDASE